MADQCRTFNPLRVNLEGLARFYALAARQKKWLQKRHQQRLFVDIAGLWDKIDYDGEGSCGRESGRGGAPQSQPAGPLEKTSRAKNISHRRRPRYDGIGPPSRANIHRYVAATTIFVGLLALQHVMESKFKGLPNLGYALSIFCVAMLSFWVMGELLEGGEYEEDVVVSDGAGAGGGHPVGGGVEMRRRAPPLEVAGGGKEKKI